MFDSFQLIAFREKYLDVGVVEQDGREQKRRIYRKELPDLSMSDVIGCYILLKPLYLVWETKSKHEKAGGLSSRPIKMKCMHSAMVDLLLSWYGRNPRLEAMSEVVQAMLEGVSGGIALHGIKVRQQEYSFLFLNYI